MKFGFEIKGEFRIHTTWCMCMGVYIQKFFQNYFKWMLLNNEGESEHENRNVFGIFFFAVVFFCKPFDFHAYHFKIMYIWNINPYKYMEWYCFMVFWNVVNNLGTYCSFAFPTIVYHNIWIKYWKTFRKTQTILYRHFLGIRFYFGFSVFSFPLFHHWDGEECMWF